MADQYTWEKAKQAGYKTTLQQLSRKTIADGVLLNNYVLETLSSRDKYINDNLTAETASANSVFNTVKNNSATNWDNSLLSGFSAVKILNNNKQINGSYCSAISPFTWSAGKGIYLTANNSTHALQMDVYSAYKMSYHEYATEHTNSYTNADISATQNNGAAFVFGFNSTAKSPSIAMVRSKSDELSIAAFNSVSKAGTIALINSIANTSQRSILAMLHSTVTMTNQVGMGLGLCDGYIDGPGNVYAIGNSSAYFTNNNVFVALNSLYPLAENHGGNGIAILNSTACGAAGFGAVYCKDIYSNALAYLDCASARSGTLAMLNAKDIACSIAINAVSGVWGSFAINNITGINGCFAVNDCGFASTANIMINNARRFANDNIAINNCSGLRYYNFVINDCYDMGTNNIAINNCSGLGFSAIAINNCRDGGFILLNNCHNNSTYAPPSLAIQSCSSCSNNSVNLMHSHNINSNSLNISNVASGAALVAIDNVASAGYADLVIKHGYPVNINEMFGANEPEWFMKNSDSNSVAINSAAGFTNSVALLNSYASGYSCAINNSTANNHSLAMLNSSAKDYAVSMVNNTLSANANNEVNGANIKYKISIFEPATPAQIAIETDNTFVFII